MSKYYKLARPDGWDFYTGKTINYRENIGKTVRVPHFDAEPVLCSSSVLHASKKPNDAFVGAKIPCSVYLVKGKSVVEGKEKCGFKELFIVEEIPQDKLNQLFGWNYTEACNPVHPFKIKPPKITEEHIMLLKKWASIEDSIRASIEDSIRASIGASIWASIGASIWDSIWASIGASIEDSIWASIGASIEDSIEDSIRAYIGSLFPTIKKWKYIKHKRGTYPFQPAVDLWKQGLVASFDRKLWRLHGDEKATVLYEISKEKLLEA